jgi:outer membrane protein assembly factor BamB
LQYFQLNTPITYADGKIYIGNWKGGSEHTEDNGTYYCIDANDMHSLIWSETAEYVTGYYWAGAAIVGNYIIYGDDRANVTCRDKDTGAFVDYINVAEQCGGPVEEIRSSIVWNEETGRIYFTGKKPSPRSGHTYAVVFNDATGDLGGDGAVGGGTCEWNTSIDYSTSTPVVYNGKVYVLMGGMYGGDGKVLKCLNEANGNLLYTYDIPNGASQASPAVSVWNGHVYIYFTTNMNNGSVYCVEDTGTGFDLRWVWNPPLPDNQYILQGMAISKGIVYFGTDYGRIYALAGDCGDVNYDGYVDSSDIGLVTLKVSQSAALCSEWAGDVNCDGLVDSSDIGLVTQKISQGTALHCCGCPGGA